MGRVRIKMCGITSPRDATLAVEAGADAIGLIFCPSRRRVDVETARAIRGVVPPFVTVVGVFADDEPARILHVVREVGLTAVQLHGEEPPELLEEMPPNLPIIKAFRVRGMETLREMTSYSRAAAYLLDAYVPGALGGTGHAFNWDLLADAAFQPDRPWILAGGLTPGTVREALSLCRPFAVDVSSGVEQGPGVKDPKKVQAFVEAVEKAAVRQG